MTSCSPSTRTCPDVGLSYPMMILTIVDFPAPLPPMSPTTSPRSMRSRDILESWTATVELAHVPELEQWSEPTGYAVAAPVIGTAVELLQVRH